MGTSSGGFWGNFARSVRDLVLRLRPQRLAIVGVWDAELVKPDGSVQRFELGRNLIVNVGLDHLKDILLNPATALLTMHNVAIGTGVVPELNTDIALGAEVARAAGSYSPGGVGVATVLYTFPAAGGYEPAAISEAGLFDQAGLGGSMFNRKTFPAFTKEAADTLKVTCTVTVTAT